MQEKIGLEGILSGGYGIIPKNLMNDENLSPYAKLILAYMLSYTGAGDVCFPSIATICNGLKLSKPTVIKAIQECADKKYIKKTKLYPNDPLKHNNKYTLLFYHESKNDLPDADNNNDSCGKGSLPTRSAKLTSINNTINNNINNINIKDKDTKVSTPVNPKYIELSKLLYDEHKKHDDKFLAGKNLDIVFNRWAVDMRLLVEKDERQIDDVKKVIIWSQEWEGNGNFSWRNNILSGKKLREKFATLYGQYVQDGKKSKNKQLSYKKEYVDEYKSKVNIKEYVERQEKEQREEMKKNAGNSKPSKNGIENYF